MSTSPRGKLDNRISEWVLTTPSYQQVQQNKLWGVNADTYIGKQVSFISRKYKQTKPNTSTYNDTFPIYLLVAANNADTLEGGSVVPSVDKYGGELLSIFSNKCFDSCEKDVTTFNYWGDDKEVASWHGA